MLVISNSAFKYSIMMVCGTRVQGSELSKSQQSIIVIMGSVFTGIIFDQTVLFQTDILNVTPVRVKVCIQKYSPQRAF